jgi:transcription elongation factor Elf1
MSTHDRPLWQLLLELKTAVRRERPFSCIECFTLLEYLAESLSKLTSANDKKSNEEEAVIQKAVQQHLAACPNCHAYFQTRLQEMEMLLEADSSSER